MAYDPAGSSVVAFQSQPSSLLVGASIIGVVPVTGFPTNQNISGSVFAIVQGLQGASVSGAVNISNFPVNQSVSGMVNITGSVQTTLSTSSWISGTTSIFTGVIQPIIAGQGTSIFSYITAVQVANNSANPVYVSFLNAVAGSIIGYTIAPGNGGSNITMPNALKTLANGAFSASISGVASVFVTAEGFTQNT